MADERLDHVSGSDTLADSRRRARLSRDPALAPGSSCAVSELLFPTVEVMLLVVLVIGTPAGWTGALRLKRVTVGLVIVMTVDDLAG